MPSFSCTCGHVTHDEDEPAGTSLVAYTLPALNNIERRISEHVSAFVALPDGAERLAWQRSFYGPNEVPEQSPLEVIEDIVSFELNDGFMPLHRCPACNRIALKTADSEDWLFFRPEP